MLWTKAGAVVAFMVMLMLSGDGGPFRKKGDFGPFERGPYQMPCCAKPSEKPIENEQITVHSDNYSNYIAAGALVPNVQPFVKPQATSGACELVDGYGWGGLSWPVDSRRIKSHRVFAADNGGGIHRGVDIDSSVGAPVYAASAGVVVWAGMNYSGWGQTVILAHGGGYQTVYAHLSSVDVICGQSVGRGEVIGASGMTGLATWPHLHLEVRAGDVVVDPLQWLTGYELYDAEPVAPWPKATATIEQVKGGNSQ